MSAVVFVGLMGTGKSTVGGKVADATGRELIDTDQAIEARTGKNVRELWEDGGEAAYRALESQVVLEGLERGDEVVIAAPGGIVLDPVAREALGRVDVVWLRASPEELGRRVKPGDHRPLLGNDPVQVLTEMARDRSDLYASVADLTVDVDDLGPDDAAAEVLQWLGGRPASTTD